MLSVNVESETDTKLADLLEEFLLLLRSGRGIPVRDFARMHPEFSDCIVADFPTMLVAKGLKPRPSAATGTVTSANSAHSDKVLTGQDIRQISRDLQLRGSGCQKSGYVASLFASRWVLVSSLIGIPVTVIGLMYVCVAGFWTPATTIAMETAGLPDPKAAQQAKFVEHQPDLQQTGITTSVQKEPESEVTLTQKDVEQNPVRTEPGSVIKKAGQESNKVGFAYDKLDHPLTNAIRHLDLVQQTSELTLSTQDKSEAQTRLATVGEAVRKKILTDKEISELLALLPEDSNQAPFARKISEPQLIQFLIMLKNTYDVASRRLLVEQSAAKNRLAQELQQKKTRLAESIPATTGKGKKAPVPPRDLPY